MLALSPMYLTKILVLTKTWKQKSSDDRDSCCIDYDLPSLFFLSVKINEMKVQMRKFTP